MKPLVMWARINRGRLHIHEHTREHVRGRVVYGDGSAEPFHYDLARRRLTLGDASPRTLQLDEMGVEVA